MEDEIQPVNPTRCMFCRNYFQGQFLAVVNRPCNHAYMCRSCWLQHAYTLCLRCGEYVQAYRIPDFGTNNVNGIPAFEEIVVPELDVHRVNCIEEQCGHIRTYPVLTLPCFHAVSCMDCYNTGESLQCRQCNKLIEAIRKPDGTYISNVDFRDLRRDKISRHFQESRKIVVVGQNNDLRNTFNQQVLSALEFKGLQSSEQFSVKANIALDEKRLMRLEMYVDDNPNYRFRNEMEKLRPHIVIIVTDSAQGYVADEYETWNNVIGNRCDHLVVLQVAGDYIVRVRGALTFTAKEDGLQYNQLRPTRQLRIPLNEQPQHMIVQLFGFLWTLQSVNHANDAFGQYPDLSEDSEEILNQATTEMDGEKPEIIPDE